MVLLLTKLYLYFNTESRGGQLFSGGGGGGGGGGVQLFPGGSKC